MTEPETNPSWQVEERGLSAPDPAFAVAIVVDGEVVAWVRSRDEADLACRRVNAWPGLRTLALRLLSTQDRIQARFERLENATASGAATAPAPASGGGAGAAGPGGSGLGPDVDKGLLDLIKRAIEWLGPEPRRDDDPPRPA